MVELFRFVLKTISLDRDMLSLDRDFRTGSIFFSETVNINKCNKQGLSCAKLRLN